MFTFSIIIGVYSYVIFILGIAGLLYKNVVIWSTLVFLGFVLVWKIKIVFLSLTQRFAVLPNWPRHHPTLFSLLFSLFFIQVLVNLIGALGPELSFDALWYHLTLPKLYLQNHSIFFIPGGLLYYSAMPKLGEMLYVGGLAIGNEITAKLIHFSFGLLTCLALYKLQRKFFSPLISMIGVVIFYSNLVVAWQSIAAYIDLIRAFFEVMALWAFISWWENGRRKWLVLSSIMIGLAITTKLLAIGSLTIFILFIISKNASKIFAKWLSPKYDVIFFTGLSLLVPLPWFIFSYINTGNPAYPFFTNIYKVMPQPLSLSSFFEDVWILFTQAADPVSPIYIIILPLIILFIWIPAFAGMTKKKIDIASIHLIGIYSLLGIVVWYFTPQTGGGRFIIPYLPALSILCAACLNEILNKKQYRYFSKFLFSVIILVSIISIGYRFGANAKYMPVLLGIEAKQKFLTDRLNFSFGDFYDTDNFFRNNIKTTDKVLLFGFHNLYYVDFSFIDSSWLREGDRFNYIATQNTILPEKYKNWKLIYINRKTMVKLYKK